MTSTPVIRSGWLAVCESSAVPPEQGVAVLIGEQQIALFRTADGELYALGNRDPVSGAQVLSRGIVGSRGAAPTVTSPMYKQVFGLRTGRCLDDATLAVPTYPVRVVGDRIEILADG